MAIQIGALAVDALKLGTLNVDAVYLGEANIGAGGGGGGGALRVVYNSNPVTYNSDNLVNTNG